MDAINLLANIALPTSFGAPAAPLQPGQVVQALVLELLQSGVFRLQLPQAVLDVRSTVPLTPGGTVTLAVKATGSAVRLDILGQSAAPAAPAPAILDAAVTGQAIRRPIGEAVIVGRANLPDAPSVPTDAAAPASAPDIAPARALAEAVRAAAARQGGLAPLFADVEQAAKIAALPEPVRAAAAQLLTFRVPLDERLSATDVKQALTRSGVLLEPRLAAAIKSSTPVAAPPSVIETPPADDLKAALLVLRLALKTWAGAAPPATPVAAALTEREPPAAGPASTSSLSPEEAETVAKTVASALLARPAPANASSNPPPPYRGAPLTPQPPASATILETASPRATAERLIAETDAALSRQILLQAASLPDAARLDTPHDAGPRWTFEVPFATGQGTAILPFEVARDGRASPAEPDAAAWRARFSLDLDPMGAVHALVTLSGDRASVTLWAERPATATQLDGNSPLLGEALRAAALRPGELSFRVGSPRAAGQAAPGRFMDRAS